MHADPLSSWFQAQGIPPLWGGVLLGAALVYLVLRQLSKMSPPYQVPRVPQQRPIAAAQGDLKEQALQLVRQRKKIEAIKLVREREGLGLKEAKDVVDAWEREHKG